MEGTLLNKMNQRNNFTDIEWHAVEWMLDHKTEIGDMTVAEVAKETYSSNATVMRIAHKLGCSGFSDFKVRFVREVESQKFVQKHVDFATPFDLSANAGMIISAIGSLFRETIDIVNANLDPHVIARMAEEIYTGGRLFLYGVGDSGVTCKTFQNKLIKIGIYAVQAYENSDEIAVSQSSRADDAALFVSYGGLDYFFAECIHLLKQNGTRIYAITSNADSVIAHGADELILLPDLEGDEKYATFYSQQAFSYILNILYAMLYAKYLRQNVKKQKS